MVKIILSLIIFSKLLFCQEKIFNYISIRGDEIHGGEIENAVLPYSSTTVLFAFNLRSLWKGYVESNGDLTWQETEFKNKYGTGPQYIAVHPSNPDIILAWIDYPDPSGQPNRGLVRSEDGGKTWEKIESIDPNFVPAGRVREGISPIVFSIKNPNRVYLFGNLWSTYDRPLEEKIVLYKSTDAGKTFTEIIPFPNYAPPNYTPLSIGVTYTDESGDNDVIYIGLQGIIEPKFFKSIDTAGTWSELTIPSYNNDKGDISFISLSTNNSVAVHAGRITRTQNKIYVSTDGWKTYSEITLNSNYKIREFSPVVISPDGKRVYFPVDNVSGNNINAVEILVSTFNGTNWETPTVFFDGKLNGETKGFEFRNILINPDDQNEFYFVDNLIHGIVKRKNNGDVSFQNNNLEGASIVSGTKDKDGKLYVITKGAIYKSDDGSNWRRIHEDMLPLEWMKIITHPDTGKVYAIGFGSRTFYYDDTNQKWKLPNNTETSRFVDFDENYYTSGAPLYGTSDLVFDKTNNRLYFGVFKNYQGGSNIEGLYVVKFKNTDEIDRVEKINEITGSVHSVAISYDNSFVLFIGKGEQVYWDFQPDGLYKIELDTNDTIVSSKKLLDNVVPYKIFIDSSNSNILYAACYENKMPAGPRYTRSYGPLYVSYDGGETWNKAGGLGNYDEPKGIENVIDIKVSSTGVIYVANRDHDTGFTHLYYSLNNGISFNRYLENIGEIKTLMLGSLYVGTNVGLWKANKEPQPLTYDISKPKLYSYPNPFKPSHGYTVLKYFVPQGKIAKSVKISIYNIAGELVYEYKEDRELSGGYAYYYQWDGRNKEGKLCASGVYIAVVKSNLDTVKTKIVLIR